MKKLLFFMILLSVVSCTPQPQKQKVSGIIIGNITGWVQTGARSEIRMFSDQNGNLTSKIVDYPAEYLIKYDYYINDVCHLGQENVSKERFERLIVDMDTIHIIL